ncbi:MAG TPA: DUF1269 domain-containing protein [Microthrixaceae bacterium]|nr:DUF1269 domain-containing protein [Microthrixaceae bacterium]HNI33988.1 DUF1269 domain-containing protein [Microthrixaceae bacterium]
MPGQQLAVLSFDSSLKAQEFMTAVARLQEEGKILVQDAVFVTKEPGGRTTVVETTDPGPGSSALTAGAWGLLFGALLAVPIAGLAIGAGTGALMAKLVDTGVPDDFVQQIREQVKEGWTALALLVSHINRDAVLAELGRFQGAELISGDLSPEAVAAVQAALTAQPSGT